MAVELLAYADESGIHDGSHWCIVAGYIGSPRQWKQLQEEWGRTLSAYSVPEFHAQRFFARPQGNRLDYYKDWSDDRARRFISDLAEIVDSHRVNPIGRAVKIADYLSYTVGERRFLTGAAIRPQPFQIKTSGAPSRPYQLAFQLLLFDSCQLAQHGTKVHFIFDRQNVESAAAVSLFNEYSAEFPNHRDWQKLGRITFACRKKEIPLQVADLYTHGWYSYYMRGQKINLESQIAMRILTKKRPSMRNIDREFMENLLNEHLTSEHRGRLQQES